MDRRQIFIVAIEVSENLEAQVVSNYVTMAIKKYDKLLCKSENMSYFDGVKAPSFFIDEVKEVEKDDILRESIMMIKQIRDKIEGAFKESVDRPWR